MARKKLPVYAALLAGGSGTRLWPVSRQMHPKQLVPLTGQDSLVQSTVKRILPAIDREHIKIICGIEHQELTARHMHEIGVAAENMIIAEPCGRNTAPAILLAVMSVLQQEQDAVVCLFPADHVIADTTQFLEHIQTAVESALDGHIVTFGIEPGYPETGYGYIEAGDPVGGKALRVKRFVEKPDLATARQYIEKGNYYWNSGMFVFKASVIKQEFITLAPEIYTAVARLFENPAALTKENYRKVPKISIDYAIMEKTQNIVVLPSTFGWSDIGSWKALYDFLPHSADGNVLQGDVMAQETQNCLILAQHRLVATSGINDMVLIETPDAVFVSDLENSREVKSIVEHLQASQRKESLLAARESGPWGKTIQLIAQPDVQVEEVQIAPGERYQTQVGEDERGQILMLQGKLQLDTGKEQLELVEEQTHLVEGGTRVHLTNMGKGLDDCKVLLIRRKIS